MDLVFMRLREVNYIISSSKLLNVILLIIIMIFNQGAHISEEFFNEALDKIHIDNTNYE